MDLGTEVQIQDMAVDILYREEGMNLTVLSSALCK